jgi:hypothetical protein
MRFFRYHKWPDIHKTAYHVTLHDIALIASAARLDISGEHYLPPPNSSKHAA